MFSLAVLAISLQPGIKHINSGWLFNSIWFKIPLQLIGGEAVGLKPAATAESKIDALNGLAAN